MKSYRILHRLQKDFVVKSWTDVEDECQDEHQQTADVAERTDFSCDSERPTCGHRHGKISVFIDINV